VAVGRPDDTAAALAGHRFPGALREDRAEQFNVVAVMVVSQAIQVVLFTAGLFAFFGGSTPSAGTWFGVHIPVPQTIVQTSLFVAVLSGLYFTVSTSVDPLYRQRFFEPLIADVAASLAGRDAYLEMEMENGRR
jgi:hypothetical protein